MMKYFVEIQIKNNGKKSIPVVMNELISQFHYAIVEVGSRNVAMAFPDYGENLGNVLRIHGTALDLQKLFDEWSWNPENTRRLVVSQIQEIPKAIGYRCYGRVRPSKQNSKLKAGVKSGHITDAKTYRKKMFAEIITTPFFQASSSSTKQSYKVFISMKEQDSMAIEDVKFDSYGLSKNQAVPHF